MLTFLLQLMLAVAAFALWTLDTCYRTIIVLELFSSHKFIATCYVLYWFYLCDFKRTDHLYFHSYHYHTFISSLLQINSKDHWAVDDFSQI